MPRNDLVNVSVDVTFGPRVIVNAFRTAVPPGQVACIVATALVDAAASLENLSYTDEDGAVAIPLEGHPADERNTQGRIQVNVTRYRKV